MNAVVIVPTFDRPELLWHCLDHLASASTQGGDMPIRVCVDTGRGHAPVRELRVVREAHPALDVDLRFTARHTYRGNSFNVLRAFRDAYEDGFDVAYLVEDDVLVRPEFFAWHQLAHAHAPAASMGVRDPGHGAYASLGVRLPRATLALILDHTRPAYFNDMAGYCTRTFPASPFGHEQDGLIARVLAGRTVAWADPPVVSHVGWYGYHRKTTPRPTGTLEERYRFVGEVLADPARLAEAAGTWADVTQAVRPNLGTYTLSTVPGAAA